MGCSETLKRLKRALKEFLLGATVYDMVKTFTDLITYNTYAIMTVALGDMLGFPVSCYYRLRLLPLVMTQLDRWRTFMLKERDITERIRE